MVASYAFPASLSLTRRSCPRSLCHPPSLHRARVARGMSEHQEELRGVHGPPEPLLSTQTLTLTRDQLLWTHGSSDEQASECLEINLSFLVKP